MVPGVKFSKLLYLKGLHGANLTSSEYRVLVTVLCYTNANGEGAWPGVARLQDDCRMSERSVQRCLKSLRTKGWLRRVQLGSAKSGRASEFALSTPGKRASWHRKQG